MLFLLCILQMSVIWLERECGRGLAISFGVYLNLDTRAEFRWYFGGRRGYGSVQKVKKLGIDVGVA